MTPCLVFFYRSEAIVCPSVRMSRLETECFSFGVESVGAARNFSRAACCGSAAAKIILPRILIPVPHSGNVLVFQVYGVLGGARVMRQLIIWDRLSFSAFIVGRNQEGRGVRLSGGRIEWPSTP